MLHSFLPARPHRSSSLTSILIHFGAAGLFFLAILDSSPLPTFGGLDILTVVLAGRHHDLWYEYAAASTAGALLGAYITFRIARKAGSAYLDNKFKKSRVQKFLKLFKRWGTGTLIASTAIPFPTPTSMFFAAAGASDYPRGKFLAIVLAGRAARYFGLAYIAAHYGRHLLQWMRHPTQHWAWLLFLLGLIGALIAGGILVGRRLESASA